MFALTDVSGCYAAIEKIYNPSLRQRPVVVLSSSNGCVVAMCPIAKRLGIPKFEPYFKIKALLDKHGCVVRESNFELYGNASEKMMSIIATFSEKIYQYSIDEAFSSFVNYENIIKDWYQHGHKMRRSIWTQCRLPVGIGISSTLCLAKAASFASRKLPTSDGVAVINDEDTRIRTLSAMSLDEVWGIGSKLSSKLDLMGLKNAYDLANCSPKSIRQQFGVTVERIVEELNGVTCLKWDEVRPPKQQIYSTRSVTERITNAHELRSALTSHAIKVCNKARQQNSLIKKIYVFATSSPYDERYVKKGIMCDFPLATDSVLALSTAIQQLMHLLYVENVPYYKAGVGAIELESKDFQQQDLFVPNENPKLMNCYSAINSRFGSGTLQLGTEKRQEKWSRRGAFLSPCYTTKWSDIPIIKC